METLLERNNQHVEVADETSEGKEDLIDDFINIVTSFYVRIYGQRQTKRKTAQFIKNLRGQKKEEYANT